MPSKQTNKLNTLQGKTGNVNRLHLQTLENIISNKYGVQTSVFLMLFLDCFYMTVSLSKFQTTRYHRTLLASPSTDIWEVENPHLAYSLHAQLDTWDFNLEHSKQEARMDETELPAGIDRSRMRHRQRRVKRRGYSGKHCNLHFAMYIQTWSCLIRSWLEAM